MALRLFEGFDYLSGIDAHKILAIPYEGRTSIDTNQEIIFAGSGITGFHEAICHSTGLGLGINYPSYAWTTTDILTNYGTQPQNTTYFGLGLNVHNLVSGRNGRGYGLGFTRAQTPSNRNFHVYASAGSRVGYSMSFFFTGFNSVFFSRSIVDGKKDFFVTFDWAPIHNTPEVPFQSGNVYHPSLIHQFYNQLVTSLVDPPTYLYRCGPFSLRLMESKNANLDTADWVVGIYSGKHFLQSNPFYGLKNYSYQYFQVHHILGSGDGMFEFKANGNTLYSKSGINTLRYFATGTPIDYSFDMADTVLVGGGIICPYIRATTSPDSILYNSGLWCGAIDNLAVFDESYPIGRPTPNKINLITDVSRTNFQASGVGEFADAIQPTGAGFFAAGPIGANVRYSLPAASSGSHSNLLGILVTAGGAQDFGANTGYNLQANLLLSGNNNFPSGNNPYLPAYPAFGTSYSLNNSLINRLPIRTGDLSSSQLEIILR